MKSLIAAAFIVVFTAGTGHAAAQAEAKRELQGWGKAAAAYEQTCDAGKLRQQMPREKAVHAYECFARIIDANVELQYPDLYAKLDGKMKEAHSAYGAGKSGWEETLKKLAKASDEYNAAVARRNQQAGND